MSKDDMQTMIPAPRVVKVGDEEITIKTLKVGKLTQVIQAVQPIAHLLPKPGSEPRTSPIDFTTLVIEHTPAVIDLMVLLLEKDKAWVEELELDSVIEIFTAIVEVNLDFFIQRVIPSVLKAMGQLNGVFQAKQQILSGLSPSKG